MAIDTKPNLNSEKFEQFSGDTLNLSGTTRIFGLIEYAGNAPINPTAKSFAERDFVTGDTFSGVNGLTKNGASFGLGGEITGDTFIYGGTGYTLSITELSGITLSSSNTKISGSTDIELRFNQNNIGYIKNSEKYREFGNGFNIADAQIPLGGVYNYDTQRTLIIGGFETFNNEPHLNIVELNLDGSINKNFILGFDQPVFSATVDSINGQYYLTGDFTEYFQDANISYPVGKIVRLDANNGILDQNFIDYGFSTTPSIRLIYDNILTNKLYAYGDFSTYSGFSSNNIIRLNSDGTIDYSFDIGTGFNGVVGTVEILSDGKLLVGGDFTDYNGTAANRIIKLNDDGSIDNTFNYGTGFDGNVVKIQRQLVDTSIIVIGEFAGYDGNANIPLIAKLDENGVADTGFTNNYYNSLGTIVSTFIFDFVVEGGTGDIYLTGAITNNSEKIALLKLNSDGSLYDSGNYVVYADSNLYFVYNRIIVQENNIPVFTGNIIEMRGNGYNTFDVNGIIRLKTATPELYKVDNIFTINNAIFDYTGITESSFNQNSLVNKKYVDSVVTGSSAVVIASITANNGLTKSGNNIRLGGTLTGYTTIDGDGQGIELINMDSGVFIESNGGSITLQDNGGGGVTIEDTGGGGVYLNDASGGGIYLDSSGGGGIYIDDNNAGGIYLNSVDNAGSVNLTAGANGVIGLSNTTFELGTANASIFSNGTSGLHIRSIDQTNGVRLEGNDVGNVNRTRLELSTILARFSDSRTGTTAVGLEYNADYSTNFTPRSLVDKAYVTGLTSSAASKSSTTITGTSGGTTTFNVVHNKNTRDVIVQVYEVASPYGTVIVDVERVTVNAVDVKFAIAPATGVQYRVVII